MHVLIAFLFLYEEMCMCSMQSDGEEKDGNKLFKFTLKMSLAILTP